MTLRDAKNLISGDEVIVKATGESTRVINAYLSDDGKTVFIECCTRRDGFTTLTHRNVK